MTDETEVKAKLKMLNSPEVAREYLARLNVMVAVFGDEKIKVEDMDDKKVVQFANKTMCFAMAAIRALTTL